MSSRPCAERGRGALGRAARGPASCSEPRAGTSGARGGREERVALLASGIWMMALSWGHEPWIVVALLGIVAMGALGGAMTSRRIRQLRGALEAEDRVNLLDAFRCGGAMTALSASLRVRIGIAIGVVALMTLKPAAAYATSLLVLAVAAAGGAVASIRLGGRAAPLPERPPA